MDEVMARSDDSPDDALVAERFEALFRAHHRAVVAYVRRRAAAESVDDVVADTFMAAWRRLDRVPADAPLPWLLGIARHVIATQRRSALRRDALRSRLRESAHVAAWETPNIADGSGAIGAALARLDETDREVLTLIGWDGLRPSEAAAVLGERPSAFYVHLHRAKRRLRRLLEETGEQPAGVPVPRIFRAEEPTS
jgi:RNA polymerase sigma-70 factor (ECF subfamily)